MKRNPNTRPSIFIGLPVFNGGSTLKLAIDNMLAQTYPNWYLLISDNASTDATESIARKYAERDTRISYHRHPINIGAARNFDFVLQQARTEFFTWIAADDEHSLNFLCILSRALANAPDNVMAFGQVFNTNQEGRPIRTYQSFARYASPIPLVRVWKFMTAPEAAGKANLIYAVYRTDFVKQVWEIYPLNDSWGSDMNFVLAALARGKLIVDSNAILFKRLSEAELAREPSYDPRGSFPIEYAREYAGNASLALRGTGYGWLALLILHTRAIKNQIATIFVRMIRKIDHICEKIRLGQRPVK